MGLYGAARAGFGPGVSLLLLARAAPAAVLAGIDPSRVMLRMARRRSARRAWQAQPQRTTSTGRLPFCRPPDGEAVSAPGWFGTTGHSNSAGDVTARRGMAF